jgi:hypothetical protein
VEWHFTGTDTDGRDCISDPGFTYRHPYRAHGNKARKEHLMLDVLMLALGLGFFVAAVGYTYACERL